MVVPSRGELIDIADRRKEARRQVLDLAAKLITTGQDFAGSSIGSGETEYRLQPLRARESEYALSEIDGILLILRVIHESTLQEMWNGATRKIMF